jgi:serine/threonine-protein kinase
MATARSPRNWVGQMLGERYRVTDVLGSGGMAITYVGVDTNLGRLVAIKVPHANLMHHPGFLQRFEREAESLMQAQFPKIVQVLDVGRHLGSPFLVMQHLAGGSLADRLEARGAQRPEAVARWLPDLAESLDYVHSKGLIHRDVKPANILFDANGHPFLADFGVAKIVDHGGTTLTQTGMLPGAPAYMPPETARGDVVTPAADQYSLGLTVYEALSGRLPYENLAVVPMLMRKQSADPTALMTVVPELPTEVGRCVMRAIARDPARRYPNCSTFARAFEHALEAPQKLPWPLFGVCGLTATAAVLLFLGGRGYMLSMALVLAAGGLWLTTLSRQESARATEASGGSKTDDTVPAALPDGSRSR